MWTQQDRRTFAGGNAANPREHSVSRACAQKRGSQRTWRNCERTIFVSGRVLGFALENSSAEVVQILLDAGARLDHVGSYLLSELFEAGTEKAQEDCHEFFEAPLKCELLIRAFPDLQGRYM
jgi:hypothetical protein